MKPWEIERFVRLNSILTDLITGLSLRDYLIMRHHLTNGSNNGHNIKVEEDQDQANGLKKQADLHNNKDDPAVVVHYLCLSEDFERGAETLHRFAHGTTLRY